MRRKTLLKYKDKKVRLFFDVGTQSVGVITDVPDNTFLFKSNVNGKEIIVVFENIEVERLKVLKEKQ